MVAGNTLRWNEKIWTEDKAKVSMRLTYYQDELLVDVVPEHRRWRRLYRLVVWDFDMPAPIGRLPNLPAGLTYLRIDVCFLPDFLGLELSVAALRRVHIDVKGGPSERHWLQQRNHAAGLDLVSFATAASHTPRVRAPCPLLEDITLFARRDAPVQAADSRRIAFLAQALGQCARRHAERAALNLVGVEFATPVASALLGETFSAVRTHAFAVRGSRQDSDEGLWDCELFDRV